MNPTSPTVTAPETDDGKFHTELAHRLVLAIRAGEFARGDKLPAERALAQQFDVSRPVVRNALKLLAKASIISLMPGARTGGAVVIDDVIPVDAIKPRPSLNWDELPHVFEMRRLVEVRITILASHKATDKDLEAMRHAVDLSRAASQKASIELTAKLKEEINIANIRFNRAVAHATHSATVQDVMDLLNRQLDELKLIALQDRADALIATSALNDTYLAIKARSEKMITAVLDKRLTILEAVWEKQTGLTLR